MTSGRRRGKTTLNRERHALPQFTFCPCQSVAHFRLNHHSATAQILENFFRIFIAIAEAELYL
jgi:hypothetical protein